MNIPGQQKLRFESDSNKYMCDFETTVYPGQTKTEVWASAFSQFHTDICTVHHSIHETFAYFLRLHKNVILYYHNLKFDGYFWLDMLYRNPNFKPAFGDDGACKIKDMPDKSFNYCISAKGQWYWIRIKYHGICIEIRDSLKLLPFSVKKIGKDFGTKHKKLEMEYIGERYAGCPITPEEEEYIRNDVFVVKEALEMMEAEGHSELTIGSACLTEMRKVHGYKNFVEEFPDLSKVPCPVPGFDTVDDYIRRGYRGAFCWIKPEVRGKIVHNGKTFDNNSEYPFIMENSETFPLPCFLPDFYFGEIPDISKNETYFVRFKCRFELKPKHVPTVQIKRNPLYPGREWLTTSDYKIKGKYYKGITLAGQYFDAKPELVMFKPEFEMFKKHYNVTELEILDCAVFPVSLDPFSEYIGKYKRIKMTCEGAKRTEAKLFSNNAYGRMAKSSDNSYKIFRLDESTNTLKSKNVESHTAKAGHIACGAAIIAWSRCLIISLAQANYDLFCYCDTDSLHLLAGEYQDIPFDTDKTGEYGLFKLENTWTTAKFVRPKCYLEFDGSIKDDTVMQVLDSKGKRLESEDKKFVNDADRFVFRCAGMPDICKDNYLHGRTPKQAFSDLKVGLKVPGKLRPKKIPGGIILEEIDYQIKATDFRD